MSSRETMQFLLARTEDVSGYPVEVIPDEALSTPAAVRMARGDASHHIILYNPKKTGTPDYYVCLQCGFVLRHFAVPAEDRHDLTAAEKGREAVREQLTTMSDRGRLPGLGESEVEALTAHLLSGLGIQLRSVPIEMRVNAWLLEEHPELRSAQETAVRKQLIEDTQALETRKSIPTSVFRTSVSMNSTQALYWAGALGDDGLARPYREAGYTTDGRHLLRMWHRIDADPASDQELIDAWAKALKALAKRSLSTS